MRMSLEEELNSFFTHFESPRQNSPRAAPPPPVSCTPASTYRAMMWSGYSRQLIPGRLRVQMQYWVRCWECVPAKSESDPGPSSHPPKQLAIALHSVLSHLEQRESYVRMLFVDYSSAFNIIIPDVLITKLKTLGLPSMCLDKRLLIQQTTNRETLSPTFSPPSHWTPAFRPLLYSLYTQECSSAHDQIIIKKFVDDTTLVGVILVGGR